MVCYLTSRRHLLVLTHLDVPLLHAGVQVPAGTIEAGESAERAAVREVQEETRLTGLSVVGAIGADTYDISPMRYEIQHRTFVHLRTDADVSRRWQAGEARPSDGGAGHRWECWWMPMEHAHVLAAAQGRFIHLLA